VSNVESNGSHVIAEYDGNNNLLRKYIYGPGIDQPVSMIDVADSNATYYYHYDALGSVIALSDSSGDTVQTYEYSVFGEPAVEDANHTNPYMFAGRRYDIEIGLYYNRARYYNPYTGRFLQTDPIGYGDGMNMYGYCGNSPLAFTDPTGLSAFEFAAMYGVGTDGVWGYVTNIDGNTWALEGPWNGAGLSSNFEISPWNFETEIINGITYFTQVENPAPSNAEAIWATWVDPICGAYPLPPDPSLWDSAVGAAADALAMLPSDETLYAVGDTCTTIGVAAGTTAIVLGTAGLATPALTSEGLLASGAAAGTTATAGASLVGRIGTAARLRAVSAGSGLRVHHLIEQRFAGTLGQVPNQMISVVLDPTTHQKFTNAWRDAIGYSNSLNSLNTNTATPEQIWQAARRIYQNYPELLQALGL